MTTKENKIYMELIKRLVFTDETAMYDSYNNRYTQLEMKKGYTLIVTRKTSHKVATNCNGRHYGTSSELIIVEREGFETRYFKSLESFTKALAYNLI